MTSSAAPGDLVGDGDHRRPQLVAGRIALALQVAQHLDACGADRDVGRSLAPRAAERVADDDSDLAARQLVQPRAQVVPRRRPDRPGSRTSVPGSGAFDASTPADAQMKPWRVSAITSEPRVRTTRFASRRIDLDPARVAVARRAHAREPRARPRPGARCGPRSSRSPSARRRARRRPPGRRARRSCPPGRRLRGAPAARGRARSSARSQPDDLEAGVAAVTAVEVDDHRGHALEGSGARQRARVEGAARDERRRELECSRLGALVVAANERVALRLAGRELPGCRASGAPRRPGREGVAAPARRATRDRRPGSAALFSKRIWLATLRTGVSPIASASSAVVERAAEASTESTTRSTPATASAFVAPALPISAAVAAARSGSREPIVTSIPASTSRAARAEPNAPVPPSTATFMRGPLRARLRRAVSGRRGPSSVSE